MFSDNTNLKPHAMEKIIILSAPSGSGKTTIAKRILSENPGLEFSISATSRSKRTGEVDGKDYYFIGMEDFKSKIETGDFVEWEEVYSGHLYGTLKSELERIKANGHHALFDVDVYGGMNLKSIFGNRALGIFIQPPDLFTLKGRLLSRSSDSAEKIRMRLNKAEEELTFSSKFDQVIVNDDLDQAVERTTAVIQHFLKTQ